LYYDDTWVVNIRIEFYKLGLSYICNGTWTYNETESFLQVTTADNLTSIQLHNLISLQNNLA